MSMEACLIRLEAEGIIDAERAARFRGEYARLNRAYGKTMGAVAAADLATRDTMDALERAAMVQRRQTLLQVDTQRRLLTGLGEHIEAGGKAQHFAVSVMEHHEAVQGSLAVENRRGALFRLAWSRMDGFLGRYNRDLLGRVQRGDELREMVRVLRGEASDNASAREMAPAVADTMEWLRQQFNLAGGDIPRLKDWGLPQSHDALEVATAGFEAWRAFIKPLIDPGKMIDASTGKPFTSDEALDEALEAAWRNIASEGMDGQVPGAFTGQGKVANRRSDHRFFVFRDADSWLAYNDRFGSGDVLDAITGHIDSMTRDIAAMQVLGPNPAATVRWLGDVLRQDALPTVAGGRAPKLAAAAKKGADTLQTMWDYYSGSLTAVAPEHRGTARFFEGVRNWNVASKLGSAAVSAVSTDPVFLGTTAKFNGLPVTGVVGDWIGGMASAGQRDMAEHAGLIFADMIQRTERLRLVDGSVNKTELTRRAANVTLRASGLTGHTVRAKQSLGLGFMKDWAEHADQSFAQLDAPKRMALERYGIDASDWDRLREVPALAQGHVRLLRPGDLARSGKDGLAAATKFFALIDSETRFGVPGESLRAQAAVATLENAFRGRRGTIGGELLHSAAQFKTYSVIMVTTHLMRALYGRGGISRKAYAAMLPTFLTFGGVLANAMLDIANGKDPAPLAEDQTWARGFVRGGGLGVVSDIIAQGVAGDQGTGGAVGGFLLGPTLSSVVEPTVNLTLGNIGQAAQGKDTNFEAELVRQVRKMTPGGNIWYARAAFNRMWMDQLQELADPDYARSYRRLHATAAKSGTQYWWAPGEAVPERAPDLSNAIEGETRP